MSKYFLQFFGYFCGMEKGRLFLIPTTLGDTAPEAVIPFPTLELLKSIGIFVVEETRTARRFLSRAGLKGSVDSLEFYELNEHTDPSMAEQYVRFLLEGKDVAVISEAGLPAVADPGALLVELSHRYDIEVIPHVGPSSLMMALMSSGMNGQCFAFNGYLPVKSEERRARIQELEKISARLRQTQIMIETPYRNDALMADILSSCRPMTRVCIAADITLETQTIRTRTVEQWRKSPVTIGKRPCVFLILA